MQKHYSDLHRNPPQLHDSLLVLGSERFKTVMHIVLWEVLRKYGPITIDRFLCRDYVAKLLTQLIKPGPTLVWDIFPYLQEYNESRETHLLRTAADICFLSNTVFLREKIDYRETGIILYSIYPQKVTTFMSENFDLMTNVTRIAIKPESINSIEF